MTNSFFERPILNSPHEGLRRHWELVKSGQPAQKVLERRWRAGFIAPISKPKKWKTTAVQQGVVFDGSNYHAFKQREGVELSAGGRSLLMGCACDDLDTAETEGQMIRSVMPDLMGMKNILVPKDEAHHWYRQKPDATEEISNLKGEDKDDAKKDNEASRLRLSGLEAVNRKLGVGCSLVGKGIGTDRLPNASATTRAALDQSRPNHTGADVDPAVNWEARK